MKITEKQKQLVEDNHNLIYALLNQYHFSIEEYYDLAAIGLCKAAMTFNDTVANFSTYAYKCMYSIIVCELRKSNRDKRIPKNQILYYEAEVKDGKGDRASFINHISSNENLENDVLLKVVLEKYMSKLDDRGKEILNLLRSGYSQREICKMLNCTWKPVWKIKEGLKKWLIQ